MSHVLYSLKIFRLYTLLGFMLGFLAALVTMVIYARFTEIPEYHSGTYMYESTQFKTQLDNDLALVLAREVRILCIVLTCPKYHESRAAHVRATWGKRCTNLLFTSSESDDALGAVAVVDAEHSGYHDLWNKTRESFRYAYEQHFEDYDWFLKADDDTYIIMENLRYMLAAYEPTYPIYFGHKIVRYQKEYMSGGAAYVLSKEALRRFMTEAFDNINLCPPVHRYAAEDLYLGMCLQNVGVLAGDSRYALEHDTKPKFFPLELSAYMEPNWNMTLSDWLFEMTPYPIYTGLDCCSNYSIAFHYIEPQTMYAYEFLIYHLKTYGLHKTIYQLPSKISFEQATTIFSDPS